MSDEYYRDGYNINSDASGGHTGRILGDIKIERIRQKSEERWSPAHDDTHIHKEMSKAAACYCLGDSEHWPWSPRWWKPKTYRQNLIRAAALIVAEIERLDRAEKRDVA